MTTHERVWLAIAVWCAAVAGVQTARLTEAEGREAVGYMGCVQELGAVERIEEGRLRSLDDCRHSVDVLRETRFNYVIGDPSGPPGPRGPSGVDPAIEFSNDSNLVYPGGYFGAATFMTVDGGMYAINAQ